MYDAYQAGKYKEAKAIKLEADKQYSGNSLQSKFDLLYAFCVARTDSLTVFLDLLQIIKENYVGTSVAVTATEMLEYYQNRNKPKVDVAESTGSFTYQPSTPHVYILTFQGGNAEQIKRAYGDFNKDQFNRDNLQVVSTLLGDLQVLMVKSFKTKADAEKYYVRFISNRDFFDKLELKKYDNLFISEDNFKILLKEKDINNYFEFFTKFYIQ
jgi:ribosomal protein L33